MRLIAHRGFAAQHPENTVRAVERAATRADAITVDCRRCATGELVAVHDPTVDRVTDGTGRVADLSREELAALDVLDSGAGVPTLQDVFAAVPPTVGVDIELHEAGTVADALGFATSVAHHVTVVSGDIGILERAREAEPTVPRGYRIDSGESADDGLALASERDCDYLLLPCEDCTERLVNTAHRAGMSVNAWPVDTRETAESLADRGVDGILADRDDVLPRPQH